MAERSFTEGYFYMQKEKLSAFMDGEVLDKELMGSIARDESMKETWQRYHLVRDAMRGDVGEVIHFDIANRVALALENEPVRISPEQQQEQQPAPSQWRQHSFLQKLRPWASQLTQIGVAACVSLAVIVGVQQYNGNNSAEDFQVDTPVFNTQPIMGNGAPVSLNLQSDNLGQNQQTRLQERNQRLGLMLQQYELNCRIYNAPQDEVPVASQNTTQQQAQ